MELERSGVIGDVDRRRDTMGVEKAGERETEWGDGGGEERRVLDVGRGLLCGRSGRPWVTKNRRVFFVVLGLGSRGCTPEEKIFSGTREDEVGRQDERKFFWGVGALKIGVVRTREWGRRTDGKKIFFGTKGGGWSGRKFYVGGQGGEVGGGQNMWAHNFFVRCGVVGVGRQRRK